MMRTTHNPVVHLELNTADLPGASAFYAQLCRWRAHRINTACGDYLALDLGSGLGGGMVDAQRQWPIWLPYVEVDEIFGATTFAYAMGAEVLLGPREGPGGWRSVITSPATGEFALWQSKGARRER